VCFNNPLGNGKSQSCPYWSLPHLGGSVEPLKNAILVHGCDHPSLYYLKNLARESSLKNGHEWQDVEGNIILKMQ
jgi:hypothetical protein